MTGQHTELLAYKSTQFCAPIFIRATKCSRQPLPLRRMFSCFQSTVICQNNEVPPWTRPKSAEQGQVLEAVSLELSTEDLFSVTVGLIRDLSCSLQCWGTSDTSLDTSAFPGYSSNLGHYLRESSKGNNDGNLNLCSFHIQTSRIIYSRVM